MDLNMVSVRPDGGSRRHPLLFVHGAWHASWCWERFLPWFAERGWESHAVDLRGHGESPNDRSLRRTRIRHHVDDLAGVVEQMDRPPIIIAHSMGSLITQRYLEGKWLPGAILLAPIPLGGVARATFRVARRHPLAFLKANLVLDLRPLVETADRASDLLLPDDTAPEQRQEIVSRLQGESYLSYLDMMLFVRGRPPLVPTPVGIISGGRDRLFTLAEHRKMARAYGTDHVVIDDAAHDVMLGPTWEQAAEAVAEIADRY